MKTVITFVLRIVIVVLLAQSLYFKFTAHPDSVALFGQLGMGDSGRVLIGILELVAVVLLLLPGSAAWGTLLAWGIMSGALLAHFTVLGWEGDYGVLGTLAVLAWSSSTVLLFIVRQRLPVFGMWSQSRA
ncbi:MAG: DoxX family protein [Verrucomicrobiae bacterium]|nr:DoxX family protein [Verrucomicrobiae bacterium]